MSLRHVFASQSTLKHHISPDVLLPFLYQTRTLLSPAAPYRSNFRNASRARQHFSCHPHSRAHGSNAQGSDKNPTPQHHHPYHASGGQEPQTPKQRPRHSTITASEKAIFDRIFKDISQSSLEDEQPEENLEQDSLEDGPSDPYQDLNAIFEAAIRKLRHQEEQAQEGSRRSIVRFAHRPFQTALDDPASIDRSKFISRVVGDIDPGFSRPLQFVDGQLVEESIGEAEESDLLLKRACDDHRHLVRGMLENASTDVEIWKVLEKEVFSLVKQLDLQMKAEKKARRAETKKTKQEVKTNKIPSAAKKALKPTESKALTTNTLLSILQANYAHYNLYALRLWRRRHPSTPYALHILPHIKSLGPISYVLGASAGLYNEVIFLKWTQYNDVHGLADLMQEMVNQGVESNKVTLEFLRYVDNVRRKDLEGGRGEVIKAWWGLRPVREGWVRVKGFYERFRKEDIEREMPRKMEEGEEEDEEEAMQFQVDQETEKVKDGEVQGEGSDRKIKMVRVMDEDAAPGKTATYTAFRKVEASGDPKWSRVRNVATDQGVYAQGTGIKRAWRQPRMQ